MRKYILFTLIIVFELTIILFVGFSVYRRKQIEKNVLGVTYIDPINKEDIIVSPDDRLTYFYEAKPNTVEKQSEKPWLPEKVLYSINADSLNERYEYSIEKPAQTYRIITLGDSYTFGHFVNTSDNWPEKLEDLLNNKLHCSNFTHFEVINLGERGYDMDYSAHRYMKRGMKYSPDLVLWLLLDNDFLAINDETMGILYELETNATENEVWDIRKGNNVYRFWIQAEQYVRSKYSEKQFFDHQNAVMSTFLGKLHSPLVFLTFSTLPDRYRKRIDLWRSINSSFPTFVYDKLPDIEKLNGTYMPYDFHPNVFGHQLIAENVYTYLTTNNLISCDSSQSGSLR